MVEIEDILLEFRTAYSGISVTVYDTYMLYKVSDGWAKKAAEYANAFISKLNLPLAATPVESVRNNTYKIHAI